MFIGRRPDNTVYGAWTCKQPIDNDHPGIEEVEDNHPDYVAFKNTINQVGISPRDQTLINLEARIVLLERR